MPSPAPRFERAVAFTHRLVAGRIRHGDHAIDATAGNGNDTVFLANLVGPAGRVTAFDIQAEAVQATRTRCLNEEFENVLVVHASHEDLNEHIDSPVRVAMFNLGYLPGGDHSIVTNPASTLAALEAAAGLLDQGGLLTVALYEGHSGGREEGDVVRAWAAALDQDIFAAIGYGFLNQRNHPPSVVAVERL